MDKDRKRRQRRVSQLVHETISRLLIAEATDPILTWVNVTGVEMTPDLRNARVFFCTFGDVETDRVIGALATRTPILQRRLGELLKLRNTPLLDFHYDHTAMEAARIDQLVQEIELERETGVADETPSQKAANILATSKRVLICTHAKPDGDAMGSMLAMMWMADHLGKQTTVYCPDPIPTSLRFLPGIERIERELDLPGVPDATFLLDVADPDQLPPGLFELDNLGPIIVIDHHAVHGVLGDIVIREEASSTGEVLYRLARELIWPMDPKVALNLYTAMVADTGSFRQSNTTAAALRIAASLLEEGVNPCEVADQLYGNVDVERQKLLGKVLSTLRLHLGGRVSSMICTRAMMDACGADSTHLDGCIQFGREIRGVDVAILCVENENAVKVGFRSTQALDVAKLAARFGGGGHARASGATFPHMTIDAVRQTMIDEIEKELSGRGLSG
jgi:bifunctional oligoribonuclease and PAP phosphatase NrnA